jgi:hypothetical protein
MSENPKRQDAMSEIEELLPWYAAGTLDPSDVKRVEDALAREPKLRLSLEIAREDRDETILLNQSLGAPSAQAWARVLAATNAAPRRQGLNARLAALAARLAAWTDVSERPARLVWAGAAAAIVIVIEGAAILSLLPKAQGPAYQTASQQSTAVEGANAIVAFTPDATMRQIAELLAKHKATIVEGPRSGGLFKLRIGDKTMTKSELDAVIAQLSAEPIVVTALPSSTK